MEKRVKELMYLIGLDPSIYLNKYPAELSGGAKTENWRSSVFRS